ncbi:hypothetical protein V8E55_006841 [Tylopilus felleus]
MSSYTPMFTLWRERSKPVGTVLAVVSYGVFFVLTLQETATLTRGLRQGDRIARHRWMLFGYVWITFVLATVGFAEKLAVRR